MVEYHYLFHHPVLMLWMENALGQFPLPLLMRSFSLYVLHAVPRAYVFAVGPNGVATIAALRKFNSISSKSSWTFFLKKTFLLMIQVLLLLLLLKL